MTDGAVHIAEVLDGLDVESNFFFLPHKRLIVVEGVEQATAQLTACNGYLTAITAAMCCAIPPLKANEQHAWLRGEGAKRGWVPVNREAAKHFAEAGHVVAAVWKNTTGGHGHVALVIPTPEGQEGVWVTSAGRRNYRRCHLEQSFGLELVPEFFAHQPENNG